MFSTSLQSFLRSTLFFLILSLVSVSGVDNPPPKGNYTIWANDTIPAMKTWRSNIYEKTLTLYEHQTYFDDPVNCLTPAPTVEYIENESCPRVGLLLSWAVEDIRSGWKYLAEAMFPVYYNLTDNADHTRALKSDFSHYHNELYLQGALLLNATQYYLCKYQIRRPSVFYRTLLSASAEGNGYKVPLPTDYRAIVMNGPHAPSPPGSTIPWIFGNNGTFQEYNGYWWDPLFLSFQDAWDNFGYALEYAKMLVDPSQIYYVPEPVADICKQRLAQGIPKPVLENS